MKRFLALLPILFVPAFALAATPKTLKDLAAQIVSILNTATITLVFAALVIYLLGASVHIWRASERGWGALRNYLLWGILILFVMVSIWGILAILQATLFERSPYNPTSGTVQPQPSFAPVQSFE